MTRFACFLLYEYPTAIPGEICATAQSKQEIFNAKYPSVNVMSHFNGVKFSTYLFGNAEEAKLALEDYFADVGIPSGFTSFTHDAEDLVEIILKQLGKHSVAIPDEIYKKKVI